MQVYLFNKTTQIGQSFFIVAFNNNRFICEYNPEILDNFKK